MKSVKVYSFAKGKLLVDWMARKKKNKGSGSKLTLKFGCLAWLFRSLVTSADAYLSRKAVFRENGILDIVPNQKDSRCFFLSLIFCKSGSNLHHPFFSFSCVVSSFIVQLEYCWSVVFGSFFLQNVIH